MSSLVARDCRGSPGFALLITVVLLAFLVLLLVSLTSLTRVETQVAGNARVLSLARQNALFSLNIAFGQLQKHAGPDDRFTARSDITSAGPAHQPYLTGVWTRANTTNTPDAWLVSGAPSVPTDTSDVLDPSSGSGMYADGSAPWVLMVGDASVDTAAQRVRMSTRQIQAPAGTTPGVASAATVGSYAWWVGDEGVKASAVMVDPLLLANPISYNSGGTTGDDWSDGVKRARLNQLQPVRPRAEKVFTDLNPDLVSTAEQLSKVGQISQLGLVSGGPSIATRKAAFHSMTPLAEGVLVDHYDSGASTSFSTTATARLRRDLSDLTGGFHPGVSANQRLAVRTYQQYRLTIPATAQPYVAVFNPAASIPFEATQFPAFHAGPVVTEFGLRFYFTVGADGTIMLNYIVEAELWNPYAARLELETGKPLSLYIDTNMLVTAKDDAGNSYSINVTRLIVYANGKAPPGDDDDAYGVLIDTGEVWQPGEIRVLSGAATISEGGSAGSITTGQTLAAGATKIVSASQTGMTSLDLSLRFNAEPNTRPKSVQRYHPSMTFTAFTDAVNDGDAGTYVCGYGFNLINNFYRWLQDSGNGLDVRCPYLKPNAGIAPIYASGQWSQAPVDNANLSPDGAFVNLTRIALYDLPRQELISTGDLRQMTGEKSAELGSGHAGGVNQWYDRYFFSTIPRVHNWDFANGEPLPSRYVRYIPSSRASADLTKLRSGDNAARFLLRRGAFNLNSTSVDAWRMMLGQRLVQWEGVSTSSGAVDLDNVFLRVPHSAQQLGKVPAEAGTSPNNADAADTGGRRLTDAQITLIAEGIVQGIKTRGRPFPTMMSFLSSGSSPVPTPIYAGLNKVDPVTFPLGVRRVSQLPGIAVAPADIAAQLAPALTTRSDTFLVRAYGDSRNPVTNEVEGRAWCEAIVQRVPDVSDPVSGAYVEGDEIQVSPVKYPFGRNFKIISFRWLGPNDI